MPRTRLSRGVVLWAACALLLAIGMATTVVDLLQVPHSEMRRANKEGQRVIIDPVTGAISVGAANAAHPPEFDVASPEENAAKPPAEPTQPASAETAPAGENPEAKPTAATGEAAPAAPAGDLTALRTQPLAIGFASTPRGPESLVTAPAPEVTEAAGSLLIPRRGDKGVTAASLYAHRFTQLPNQHLLAFVVIDAGLDVQSIPLLMKLPSEVSIAFSPYARNIKPMIDALRNGGHETWSMIPMMDSHYPQDDPGPLGLLGNMQKDEALSRLHSVLNNTAGSVGVVLPPDEAFSSHADIFDNVLDDLTARGLYVLSTHPTHSIRQLTQDKEQALMLHRSDLWLDAAPNKAVIESKLASVLQMAGATETTVVVMTARPQTLEILQDWLSRNTFAPPTSSITLAPLSAVYVAGNKPPPVEVKKADGHGAPEAHGAPAEAAKPEAASGGHH